MDFIQLPNDLVGCKQADFCDLNKAYQSFCGLEYLGFSQDLKALVVKGNVKAITQAKNAAAGHFQLMRKTLHEEVTLIIDTLIFFNT